MKEILELIESVDPEDTNTLDEIDARVWCYNNGAVFKRLLSRTSNRELHRFSYYKKGTLDTKLIPFCRQYTRSRDALKGIRPEGYRWRWLTRSDGHCEACNIDTPNYMTLFGRCETEELAELHAILQAIEWKRNNG